VVCQLGLIRSGKLVFVLNHSAKSHFSDRHFLLSNTHLSKFNESSATDTRHNPALAKLIEVVRSTYEFTPAALGGYLIAMGVVAVLFAELVPTLKLALWISAFVLIFSVRWAVWRRFQKADPQTFSQWEMWRRRAMTATIAGAGLWGVTGWFFYGYGHGSTLEQMGLILIIYTFFVVSIPVLSLQRSLCTTYAVISCSPLMLQIALVGDSDHYKLAGELLVIVTATFVMAGTYRQSLQRAIDLKIQADELATKLQVETLAAQAARAEAEVANRGKTQFFAAASHDLRQPLHAMGLFAEALRQRVHEPEVAQLVNSINESVDALDGLFSQLLDITRIDNGGIELHEEHFQMEEILRKLRLHFEPNAFEKGLMLRLRGAKRMVFADPLIVERILRNLVSNAIRYTNDGSIMVSCRRKTNRVLLQVWDTGVGIRESEQARIFDEFYQVPNTERVNAEQRKGLGLGLSIVKRLAALMSAPLSVRSKSGHGTVFTLELPLGKSARAITIPIPRKEPAGVTLTGRLIVVVEDEPAVLAGLEVLLKGWGAQVMAFDSVTTSRAWAERVDPAVTKPDLLIVDYRLEEGLTGMDAIKALRSRFGARLPAIVVTGSTMSNYDEDAQLEDFHLLIKPVTPNKLRAMISFKLSLKIGA
jgi:two-component system, sensor histidine kinase